jgi:hypothetical protein
MSAENNSAVQTAITEKLKQVEKFEAKYGESTRTRAWRKWCTDQEYRLRETQFRNNVANSINPNTNYLK